MVVTRLNYSQPYLLTSREFYTLHQGPYHFSVLHVSKYADKTLDVHEDSPFGKEYEYELPTYPLRLEFVLVSFAGYGGDRTIFLIW